MMVMAAVLLAAGYVNSSAQLPSLTTVMQSKAGNAQGLIRPLVLGDFANVDLYAERLGRLTYTEVASWQVRPETNYLKQANAFVESVQDLREAARLRDVQRATDAFARLISSCANCHQLASVVRTISLTPPAPVINPSPPR
jgi:hypothetical protein